MSKQEIYNNLRDRGKSKKSIEKIFQGANITKTTEKIDYLIKCTKEQPFYSPNYYKLLDEEKYEYELNIFLSGAWKLDKLYDKLTI